MTRRAIGGMKLRRPWPIVNIAGRLFQEIPQRDLRALFSTIPMGGIVGDESDDPDKLILWPVSFVDDYAEFPAGAKLQMVGAWAQAGVSSHQLVPLGTDARDDGSPIDDDEIEGIVVRAVEQLHAVSSAAKDAPAAREWRGVSARQLKLLPYDDAMEPFWAVLDSHRWWDWLKGAPAPDLMGRIEARSRGAVEDAKRSYGDDWGVFVMELGAYYFAEPFSRLWYAANLVSLFHCHRDHLRFGYLLAEYRMKMRWEQPALAYEAQMERNRENGKKGGQADLRQRRISTLDRLALQNLDRLPELPRDKDYFKFAKKLAAEHDRETGEHLFSVGGKPLAQTWFADWLSQFRVKVREAKAQAHLRAT